jgi:NAD(P)-dependent dehydrogenase (short-subunit alcohol dehydrogenase family)
MTWLDGEVALVTGGGSGLGRAVVERFVREGAQVAVFDRSADKLARLQDHLGSSIVTIAGDVTSLEDNQRAVVETVKAFGQLDCFIGNAGLHDASKPLVGLSAETLSGAFDELFGVNVKGYLLGAKAALEELLRMNGRIIFTVSNAGFDPGGGGVLYTSSKWAVRGLISQLAYELAPRIRVNGVAPGPLASDLRGPRALGLHDTAIAGSERLADSVKRSSPLGFLPAAADYTGMYVLLAARSESLTMTGSVIRGDCGVGIRGLHRPRGGDEL